MRLWAAVVPFGLPPHPQTQEIPMSEEREQLDIQQIVANTNKLIAEQQKLLAEANKLRDEGGKLRTEQRKLRIDRWVAPVIIVFGGLGSFTASWAAVSALLHVAGIK